MAVFHKIPWLSLLLLLVAYGVLGRQVADMAPALSRWLNQWGNHLGWAVVEQDTLYWIRSLGGLFVAALVLLLATPLALAKLVIGNSLESEKRAFYLFLAWSLAAVFFLRWFYYSLELLLLASVTILGRLELQRTFNQGWLVFLILVAIALAGFVLGIVIADYHLLPFTYHV